MNEIDETDGQPRAYEYEPGDEGEASIGGRLIVAAVFWGLLAWAWIAACVAVWGMLA